MPPDLWVGIGAFMLSPITLTSWSMGDYFLEEHIGVYLEMFLLRLFTQNATESI